MENNNGTPKDVCDSLLSLIDDMSKPGRLNLDKNENKKDPERVRKIPGKLDPSRIPQVKRRRRKS